MNFDGMNALVTGASSGIGAEFARQLHARGAAVTLVARRRDLLDRLAADLESKRSGSTAVHALDLAEEPGIVELCRIIRSTRVDILVNNAGRGSFGYFETLDLADEARMVSLNINATLSAAHAVIPQLKERRAGAIIAISSIAGFQPLPYMATYAATKAFNLTHAMSLRHELKEFGVRVLAVCPGPTDTEFAGVARVPGQWTGVRRDTVQDVVRDSIRALEKDRGMVVPGWRGRLLGVAARLLPLDWTTRITGKAMKGSLRALEKRG